MGLISRRGRAGRVAALVAVGLAATGCTFRDQFAESTLPPMPVASTITATSSVVSSAVPNSIDLGPRTPTLVGEDCAMTGAPDATDSARLTYVFQGQLYELSDDANSARCLRALRKSERGQLTWSPSGDRVLLGPGVVLDAANKARRTGLPADAPVAFGVDGATILSLEDGEVIRRPAGSTRRTKVSFLQGTTAFALHPSGRVLAAGGTTADGRVVIAMATADGEGVRDLVQLSAGVTVTHLGWTPDGSTLVWSTGGAVEQVRAVHLPDLALTTRSAGTSGMQDLWVSDETVATTIGSCKQRVTVRILNPESTFELSAFAPFGQLSTRALGFLDDQLVVEARPQGCTGPADLWAVDPADPSTPVLLVSAVERAALRTVPRTADPPPAVTVQAVPG